MTDYGPRTELLTEEMKAAVEREAGCQCDEAWTERGMHSEACSYTDAMHAADEVIRSMGLVPLHYWCAGRENVYTAHDLVGYHQPCDADHHLLLVGPIVPVELDEQGRRVYGLVRESRPSCDCGYHAPGGAT